MRACVYVCVCACVCVGIFHEFCISVLICRAFSALTDCVLFGHVLVVVLGISWWVLRVVGTV